MYNPFVRKILLADRSVDFLTCTIAQIIRVRACGVGNISWRSSRLSSSGMYTSRSGLAQPSSHRRSGEKFVDNLRRTPVSPPASSLYAAKANVTRIVESCFAFSITGEHVYHVLHIVRQREFLRTAPDGHRNVVEVLQVHKLCECLPCENCAQTC